MSQESVSIVGQNIRDGNLLYVLPIIREGKDE